MFRRARELATPPRDARGQASARPAQRRTAARAARVPLRCEPCRHGAERAPLARRAPARGRCRLLALDGDERAAVRVEAVAVGDAPARLLAAGADDGEGRRGAGADEGALVRAAESMTPRMNSSAGRRPVALARRGPTTAPALAAARSMLAVSTGSRAMRSRLATTSTPAPCSRRLARAATRAGRSSTGVTLHTPWSTCQAAT